MIQTKTQQLTAANIIKNETNEGANTATRVGSQLVNQIDSIYARDFQISNSNGTLTATITGDDCTNCYWQIVRWNKGRKDWSFVSGQGILTGNTYYLNPTSAKTATPRTAMASTTETLSSTQITSLMIEMKKLVAAVANRISFTNGTYSGHTLYRNFTKGGKHWGGSTHDGAQIKNVKRYGIAIERAGKIISNVIPVDIYFDATDDVCRMRAKRLTKN